jgi:hypothetical protein
MHRRLSLTAFLLAVCGLAGAQTRPAAAPAPAEHQQPAAVHPAPEEAGGGSSRASLPPEQQRLLEHADQLVALAEQLKAEVNKTNQYTLSLRTLQRADDIEKLAKSLQKQIDHPNR